jgi:hypothetical protein
LDLPFSEDLVRFMTLRAPTVPQADGEHRLNNQASAGVKHS